MKTGRELFNDKKMILIMSLPSNDPALVQCAFDSGADVVKVHANVHHRASQRHFGSLDEERPKFEAMFHHRREPMGIMLGTDIQDVERDMDAAQAMGFQIVSLYGHHTPVSILRNPHFTKMIACDYTYTMEEIRAMKHVGVDVLEASIVHPDGYGQPLNGKDLLQYHLICKQSGLPVVVPTQRRIKPSEIGMLYDQGVQGLMIGSVVTGVEADTIHPAIVSFRNAIDRLG